MFEYITLALQVALVFAIVLYIGRKLCFMGLSVYRDRLWVRLAELEFCILKQKADDLLSVEQSKLLMEYTKKTRSNFSNDDPIPMAQDVLGFLEKCADAKVDGGFARSLLTIQVSFLATKSTLIFFLVMAFMSARDNKSRSTFFKSRSRNVFSPVVKAVLAAQSVFSEMPAKQM